MIEKYYMQWSEVKERLQFIDDEKEVVYGIPRGGMCMVAAFEKARVTVDPNEATIIVDDICDGGATRDKWMSKYPHAKFWAMVDKCDNVREFQLRSACHKNDKQLGWIVFPWETDKSDTIENHITRIYQMANNNQQFDQDEYDCFEFAIKNFIKQIINPMYNFKEYK
jgi:hypothetical protein